jgi:hypothetical protein
VGREASGRSAFYRNRPEVAGIDEGDEFTACIGLVKKTGSLAGETGGHEDDEG